MLNMNKVLILIVMEYFEKDAYNFTLKPSLGVLILIVMEYFEKLP